jgi:hypothetical protein
MKKLLQVVALTLVSSLALAAETIVVLNPQGPTHSGTAQLMAVVDLANKTQKKYNFVTEFKVGGFESIAVRELAESPQTKIATITNASIEGISRGLINETTIVPLFSQGDACWAVIALADKNIGLDSVKSSSELIVGTPAIGGAAHLTALEIGKRYNIPVRIVTFRSSYDTLVNMAANNGANITLERVVNYENFKDKNKNLQIIAMSCPQRHPGAPDVKTLKEYGIDAPYIWQQLVANKDMPKERQDEISNIFKEATLSIGQKQIQALSDQIPPIFNGVASQTHYYQSFNKLKSYRVKFKNEIEAAR